MTTRLSKSQIDRLGERLSAFLLNLSENVHARELELFNSGMRLTTEQIKAEFKALLPKNF